MKSGNVNLKMPPVTLLLPFPILLVSSGFPYLFMPAIRPEPKKSVDTGTGGTEESSPKGSQKVEHPVDYSPSGSAGYVRGVREGRKGSIG